MWIPYHGPEPFEEVCDLCGAFQCGYGAIRETAAAKVPCPEPWPTTPDDDWDWINAEVKKADEEYKRLHPEEPGREEALEALKQQASDGNPTFDEWMRERLLKYRQWLEDNPRELTSEIIESQKRQIDERLKSHMWLGGYEIGNLLDRLHDDFPEIIPSTKNVYEVHMLRPNGESCGVEIIEFDTDPEAIAWAQNWANKMCSTVVIKQTPFVNTTSVSSTDLWPDEIRLVDRLEPIITPQP